VFQPALAPAAAIFALGPFVPLGAHAFMPSFLLLVCMSQQFHAWSHMKKSELPGAVVALQVGLIDQQRWFCGRGLGVSGWGCCCRLA
jgi:ubiquitin-conjugating enzyme E2 variant